MKLLYGLAAALVAVVFTFNAYADDFQDRTITRIWGDTISATNLTSTDGATNDSANFGFQSDFVRVCLTYDSVDAYVRFGHTVAATAGAKVTAEGDITRMTIAATSEALFITGTGLATPSQDTTPGRAIRIRSTGVSPVTGVNSSDERKDHCFIQPWRTRGITMVADNSAAASVTATIDVWAFSTTN